MSPRPTHRPLRAKALLPAAITAIMAASGTTIVGAPAQAEPVPPPPPPVMHNVKYTVWTETPFPQATIYYRDTDPPNFADYSHNPYVYSPRALADVGPSQKWTLDVALINPDQWAMVTATSLDYPTPPNFHCVLAVDGKVVSTNQGPRGALCSIRSW